MQYYGLLGKTLKHSFSQAYFTQKFEHENIHASYVNIELPEIQLLRSYIAENHIQGFNVTIPYKQSIIPYLDYCHSNIVQIGAVNAVKAVHNSNKLLLIGYNTDVAGFRDTLTPHLQKQHTQALIFGNGGASLAVAYVLKNLGIAYTFVNRTIKADCLTYEEVNEEHIFSHKLLINTTPVGQYPKPDECVPIPYQSIGSEHLVYDLVYNPSPTLFLQKAHNQGATVEDGLAMLHRQAEVAWQIFSGDADLNF